MSDTCSHLDQIRFVARPEHVEGCEECLKTGGWWVHLRMCQECGKIGCCDSSPGKHASKHADSVDHPVLRSIEPGENWSWCVKDQVAFVLEGA
jgi:hypothetical protein